ncbi:hypothetical protein A2U01_0102690, partial [Trifolium medium]|nr:hypothetical protein [Trifolium medium]
MTTWEDLDKISDNESEEDEANLALMADAENCSDSEADSEPDQEESNE